MKKRYCEMCDEWTNANPCKECGAVTLPAGKPKTDAKAEGRS